MSSEHVIVVGAFTDTAEGCEGEPLLQVSCRCGFIILESGDGWDEMVSLWEICDEARKHLKKEKVPAEEMLATFPKGIRW